MSATAASLFVAVQDDIVYVRVVGRATFACGPDFSSLVEGLIAKGHKRFAIDMKECPLMDSTFIGLLTGFGMQLPPGDDCGLSIHHMSPRVADLLTNLGVSQLFLTCPNDDGIPADLNAIPAKTPGRSHDEIQQTCLKAHQTLMEANPENVARFKDVTKFLEEDLKRSKESKPGNN
jgi:anti-anti-sigma regulatory factor